MRAALAAELSRVRADLREVAQIDPSMAVLLSLEQQNAEILERQLRALEAGDEIRTNEIADEARVVFSELRSELQPAGVRFSEAADSARRYTLWA